MQKVGEILCTCFSVELLNITNIITHNSDNMKNEIKKAI